MSHFRSALNAMDGVEAVVTVGFDEVGLPVPAVEASGSGRPGRSDRPSGSGTSWNELLSQVRPDVIVHAGWAASARPDLDRLLPGTLRLAAACRKTRTPLRVVFISDSIVYGCGPALPSALTERVTPTPSTPPAARWPTPRRPCSRSRPRGGRWRSASCVWRRWSAPPTSVR
ncbi:NAD-dependent epimerase/dehydratase family protein [Catenulispora yoronensis]